MPRMCCIPLCDGARNGRRVQFFRIPTDPDLRKIWLDRIPRKFEPTKSTVVCDLHFAPQDISQISEYFDARSGQTLSFPLNRSRLKKDAVPSIFPDPNDVRNRPIRSPSELKRARKRARELARDARKFNDADMITVACPDHHQALSDGLCNMWRSERGVDLYLQWGGRSFVAHQVLVDLFLSPDKLGQAVGHQGELLDSLLEFMYCGTVRVAEDNLDPLLEVAEQVEFTMLVDTLQQIKQSHVPKCACSEIENLVPELGTISSEDQSASSTKANRSATGEPANHRKPNGKRGAISSPPRIEKEKSNHTKSGRPRKGSRLTASKLETAETSEAAESTEKPEQANDDSVSSSNDGDSDYIAYADYDSASSAASPQPKNTKATKKKTRTRKAAAKSKAVNDDSDDVPEADPDDSASDDGTKKKKKSVGKKSKPRRSVSFAKRFWHPPRDPNAAITPKQRRAKEAAAAIPKVTAPVDKDALPEEVSKRLEQLAKELPLPENALNSLPVLRCPDCEFETTEFFSHSEHIRVAHKPGVMPKLSCRICLAMFMGHSALKAHHVAEHPNDKCYKCQVCLQTFDSPYSAERHANECKGMRARRVFPACETCGKKCLNPSRLREHMRMHSGEKLFMCHECGKRMSSQTALRQHQRIHSGERRYVCHECGKTSTDGTTHRRHLARHDPNRTPFPCAQCSRTFSRDDYLANHIKRMHTEGYVPKKSKNSRRPMSERHFFSCRLCVDPPVRGTRSQMERHRASDHPGQKIFGCEQCEYTSSNVPQLAVHARLHTGERPYKCGVCARTFRDSSYFRKHLKDHEPNTRKPFRCARCGQAFSLRGNLKYHLKRYHKLSADEVVEEDALHELRLAAQECVVEVVQGGSHMSEVMRDSRDAQASYTFRLNS